MSERDHDPTQAGDAQERIGVYVCHCGTNIAGVVDVEDVRDWSVSARS